MAALDSIQAGLASKGKSAKDEYDRANAFLLRARRQYWLHIEKHKCAERERKSSGT